MPKHEDFKGVDLVVAGPDMSGTSTQINAMINHLINKNYRVKDLRNTEAELIFLSEDFSPLNDKYISYSHFKNDDAVKKSIKEEVNTKIMNYLTSKKFASMVKVKEPHSFINPNSAEVWIMEEPTHRTSGIDIRFVINVASQFNLSVDPKAEALAHQTYRITEFARFRGPLRKTHSPKIIIRSRSEESGAYQLMNNLLPNGMKMRDYLNLPGHKDFAFKYHPTHIFIAHAPANWTEEDYLELRKNRGGSREFDDMEKSIPRQLMVNMRYATNFIWHMYQVALKKTRGIPDIQKFNMLLPEKELNEMMINSLETILRSKGL